MYYIIFSILILAFIVLFFILRKKKENTIQLNYKDDKINVKYYGKGSVFDSGAEKINSPYLFVADEDNYKAGLKLTFIVFKTDASSKDKINPNENLKDFLTMRVSEKREYFSWIQNVKKKPINEDFIRIYLDGLFYSVMKFDSVDSEIFKICELFKVVNNKYRKNILEFLRVCIRSNKIVFEDVSEELNLKRNSKDFWILKDDKVTVLMKEVLSYNLDEELVSLFYSYFSKKLKKIEGVDELFEFNHFEETISYYETKYSKYQTKKIETFISSFKNDIKIFITKYKNSDFVSAYNFLTPDMKKEIKHPQERRFKEIFSISKIYDVSEFFFLLGSKYDNEDSLSIRESKILASKLNDLGYCVIPDPHVSKKIYKEKHKVFILKSKNFYRKIEYNDYYRLIGWAIKISDLSKESILIFLGDLVNSDNKAFIEKSIDLLFKFNTFSSREIESIKFKEKDKPLVVSFIKRLKNNISKEKWVKIEKYLE